jgi:hypothetical protein
MGSKKLEPGQFLDFDLGTQPVNRTHHDARSVSDRAESGKHRCDIGRNVGLTLGVIDFARQKGLPADDSNRLPVTQPGLFQLFGK